MGGDWLTLRSDGVGILDVRATLEADDGALIYTSYSGGDDLYRCPGGIQQRADGERATC